MATNNTYNGWSNRFTWIVMLWIQNDPMLSQHIVDIVVDRGGSVATDTAVMESIQERVSVVDDAHLANDLINHALGEVNWTEIVDAVQDEVQDEA